MPTAPEATWNKGRVVGKKPPLTPDQVALIRMILGQDRALRDLALFNTALDTSFRGSDLVRLRVSDVATPAGVREIVEIRQKKTESRNARPVQARLSSGTRDSLRAYLAASEKQMHAWLFTGQGAGGKVVPHPSERKPALAVVQILAGKGSPRSQSLRAAFAAPDLPNSHLSANRQPSRGAALARPCQH